MDQHDERESDRTQDPEAIARREFLKKVGQAGATVPAVALLLAANARSASGQVDQYGGGACGCGGGGIPDDAP